MHDNYTCDFIDSNWTYPSPSINIERYIRKVVCAKDKLIVAQNTAIIVAGIDPLRPLASIIIPNTNAPTAIPIHNLIFIKYYKLSKYKIFYNLF